VLPLQPLAAHDVHDHPGGQLSGEQPRVPLQRHRLAVGDVLQQDPGRSHHQVLPPGHGLHHFRGGLGTLGRLRPGPAPGRAGRGHRQHQVAGTTLGAERVHGERVFRRPGRGQ